MTDYKKFFCDLERFDPHLRELVREEGVYETTTLWDDLFKAYKKRMIEETGVCNHPLAAKYGSSVKLTDYGEAPEEDE